jgi:hypothetical protein
MDILALIWKRFNHPVNKNVASCKSVCKCAFCNTHFKDSNSLEVYICNLDDTIEKLKSTLKEIGNVPLEVIIKTTRDFEVKRANARNKKNRMEIEYDRERRPKKEQRRHHYRQLPTPIERI